MTEQSRRPEWLTFFVVSATQSKALTAFNAIFQKAPYDHHISANLARVFRAAGLRDVLTRALLAHTTSLEEHPFWRAFMV